MTGASAVASTLAAIVVRVAQVWADEMRGSANPWTPEQGARILDRLGDREPFLASREAARHPESLNQFFGHRDYQRLRGNPVYGYWADDGFRWAGARVAWDGITPVSASARPIGPRAWDAAFAYVAKKYGLTIDRRAPVRVRGACIAAVVDPSVAEPNRGVVLEVRIESPTGPVLVPVRNGQADARGCHRCQPGLGDWIRPNDQPGNDRPREGCRDGGRTR